MAEQKQALRRLVALKLLKAGMDTRQVVARFEAERQALALMGFLKQPGEALKLHRQALDLSRRTAELWENLHRTDAKSLYNAACYRAVTARVIRATDISPAGVQAFEQEARAMAWLQKAVAAGYNKVAKIKEDSDLDALHDRADFCKLVADLEAAAVPEKKAQISKNHWGSCPRFSHCTSADVFRFTRH